MPCCSPLHYIDFANIHGIELAIDGNNHRQGHRCLCRSYRDDKYGEYLTSQKGSIPGDLVKKGKGHHGNIYSVEHNLNAHQDCNAVNITMVAFSFLNKVPRYATLLT